jgi:hypothetical protein
VIATGGGYATRALYTDLDEVIIDVQRPVILNGIDGFVRRSDLLDRSITLRLPPIPDANRRSEQEFWAEFEEKRPRILAALLDGIAAAIEGEHSVQLGNLPRMADASKWVTAAEEDMPWKVGSFVDALRENRGDADQEALENEVLVPLIFRLLDERDPWKGTPTELLGELDRLASHDEKKREDWPATPPAMTRRINRITPNLRRKGVEIERGKTSAGRWIRIQRTTASAPAATAQSGTAPQASTAQQSGDDSDDAGTAKSAQEIMDDDAAAA